MTRIQVRCQKTALQRNILPGDETRASSDDEAGNQTKHDRPVLAQRDYDTIMSALTT